MTTPESAGEKNINSASRFVNPPGAAKGQQPTPHPSSPKWLRNLHIANKQHADGSASSVVDVRFRFSYRVDMVAGEGTNAGPASRYPPWGAILPTGYRIGSKSFKLSRLRQPFPLDHRRNWERWTIDQAVSVGYLLPDISPPPPRTVSDARTTHDTRTDRPNRSGRTTVFGLRRHHECPPRRHWSAECRRPVLALRSVRQGVGHALRSCNTSRLTLAHLTSRIRLRVHGASLDDDIGPH